MKDDLRKGLTADGHGVQPPLARKKKKKLPGRDMPIRRVLEVLSDYRDQILATAEDLNGESVPNQRKIELLIETSDAFAAAIRIIKAARYGKR